MEIFLKKEHVLFRELGKRASADMWLNSVLPSV